MKDKETQIAEMANDLTENLRLCAGVKLLDHQVETIAYELLKKYQPKLPENNIVISREEYEKTIQDKLRLGIEIGKRQGSKEALEKFVKDLLSIWDDLEQWSKKYYEPHSGITPAHIKEQAKQFGLEIKEN